MIESRRKCQSIMDINIQKYIITLSKQSYDDDSYFHYYNDCHNKILNTFIIINYPAYSKTELFMLLSFDKFNNKITMTHNIDDLDKKTYKNIAIKFLTEIKQRFIDYNADMVCYKIVENYFIKTFNIDIAPNYIQALSKPISIITTKRTIPITLAAQAILLKEKEIKERVKICRSFYKISHTKDKHIYINEIVDDKYFTNIILYYRDDILHTKSITSNFKNMSSQYKSYAKKYVLQKIMDNISNMLTHGQYERIIRDIGCMLDML